MKSALVALALAVIPAASSALDASLRPVARILPTPVEPILRPEPAVMQNAPAGVTPISVQAASWSLRPSLRPRALEQKAMAKRRAQRKGAVCGDLEIQGEAVGLVPGKIKSCGIKDAVRVRSVSGVSLTQLSLMDCPTAKALKTWVDRSAKPALKNKGGGLAQIKVAAHYVCRTRNNRPGARISEHGKGRAIDISGFYLRDGREVSVLRGWGSGTSAKALRQMHKGACGPFGTVLGPEADRHHVDHFHFDTARYRIGPYCR